MTSKPHSKDYTKEKEVVEEIGKTTRRCKETTYLTKINKKKNKKENK
jgi:hypothetical protein